MERFRRAVNGKRLFTAEFKREQASRVLRGEVTVAELSRELEVSPSLVRRWKHLMDDGGQTAVAAGGVRWCRRTSSKMRSSAFGNWSGRWGARRWRTRFSGLRRRR